MGTCGCKVNPVLGPNTEYLGADIIYCAEHAAAPALLKALVRMLEVWYHQESLMFDLAREEAQAAVKLAKEL